MCVVGGIGGALYTRTYPSLGYARAVALACGPGAGACTAVALVSSSVAARLLVAGVTFSVTGYLGVRAELTPAFAPARQGQMQGTISALTNVASVGALEAYLRIFDWSEAGGVAPRAPRFSSIWYTQFPFVSPRAARVCIVVTAVVARSGVVNDRPRTRFERRRAPSRQVRLGRRLAARGPQRARGGR